MIMRPLKAIRKPGNSGPAVFAFSDPRPLLRDFTKNIDAKAKPSTSTSPILSLRAEGFTKPMSSEPAPSHRPGSAHWARPQHVGLYPIMPHYKLTRGEQDFLQIESSFLPNATLGSKTTLEYRNGYEKAQIEGCIGRPSS